MDILERLPAYSDEMMIDVWGKEKYIAYCEMNAFKYRMRLGHKPDQPIERDLSKARWYEDMAYNLKKELEKKKAVENNFGPIINRL